MSGGSVTRFNLERAEEALPVGRADARHVVPADASGKRAVSANGDRDLSSIPDRFVEDRRVLL